VADFGRAVAMMREGKTTDAELEFQQVAAAYPQYAAPDVNLGILYRKTDRLELSEKALRSAVEREPTNALAWTELGVTLRLRGQFKDAAEAYHQAIAADADFAPAYRNLGVLLDLYMGDPVDALSAFERYKALSGEDKPVSSWIAELRQRVPKPPAPPPPAAEPAAPAAEPAAPSANPAADSPTPAKEPAATPDRAGG
jgi:Flp pilus assembly protein TadD